MNNRNRKTTNLKRSIMHSWLCFREIVQSNIDYAYHNAKLSSCKKNTDCWEHILSNHFIYSIRCLTVIIFLLSFKHSVMKIELYIRNLWRTYAIWNSQKDFGRFTLKQDNKSPNRRNMNRSDLQQRWRV